MHMCSYAHTLLHPLQCPMLMEILFGVDGLSQLRGNVLVCAGFFQLHLMRFVMHFTFSDYE